MSDFAVSDKSALLAHSPLFAKLPQDDLADLVSYSRVRKVKRGEVIFIKGDSGSQLYAVISGKMRMSTISEDGKESVFGILGPGETFGEICLLDGGERTATVTAIEAAHLLVIERREFIPFLKKHPEVAIRLMEVLCTRLRKADEMLEEAAFLELPARLAKRLLGIAEAYGRPHAEGTMLDLKLSQQELGHWVNSSRESVNKQMKAWEGEKILLREGGRIVLKDTDAFEDIACGWK